MEPLAAESEVLTMVLVGSFVPTLMQPARLARLGLISDLESDASEIMIVSSEITQFSSEWFSLECTSDRLITKTQLGAYHPMLRDLTAGLVTQTPDLSVRVFGINHSAHFKLRDERVWHRLGDRLAPKKFWDSVGKNPGTRDITIQNERPDQYFGFVNLTFQPSRNVDHGVFLSSNDHYVVSAEERQESADLAAQMILDAFEDSLQRSNQFFSKLLEYSTKETEGDAE